MKIEMTTLSFFLAVLFMAPFAIAQREAIGSDSDQMSCVGHRTDPPFSQIDGHRAQAEGRYLARQHEFRPKMLEHADALSRCVERALRRGLIANASTTLGIHVAPAGSISKIAVLQANHSDNLYGACLVRALCTVTLDPPAGGADEVFLFSFNMRRKLKPHQRPWSLDPLDPR